MIVDCVDILAMHIIWRIGYLFSEAGTNDTAAREDLLSKRESLIEKLTDYAVGPSSSTCEDVKRAVSSDARLSL